MGAEYHEPREKVTTKPPVWQIDITALHSRDAAFIEYYEKQALYIESSQRIRMVRSFTKPQDLFHD